MSASTVSLRQTARDYYALCNLAAALGIPVSLDDPRAPRTIDELERAVEEASRQ